MVVITIGVISERINQVTKSSHHLQRRDLIMSLADEGMSYASIAERLNEMGLEKPRGGPYEAININMTIYQWRKRERRSEEHTFFLKTIRVVVK